jgi:hypothetical protein
MNTTMLKGHVPIAVRWFQGEAQIDWCFVDAERFHAPFFDDTISRYMQLPYNRALRPLTDLATLGALVNEEKMAAPSGFIFHMSRCGSSLVKQMLNADAANLVISEAMPIEHVLRAHRAAGSALDALARALILGLGRSRGLPTAHYFVKFDALHSRHMAWMARLFPDVPWVFLYRHPLEVLVSNLTLTPARMLPFAVNHDDLTQWGGAPSSIEQHIAQQLAMDLQQALTQLGSPNALVVNYSDLPLRALPAILAHFRLNPSAQVLNAMCAAAQRNAKTGEAVFVPDSENKRLSASAEAKHWCDALLMPLYAQLEARRWQP